MAIISKNPAIAEYQAALRAYDKNPSPDNKERLEQARKAKNSLSKAPKDPQEGRQSLGQEEKACQSQQMSVLDPLEQIKQSIKEAGQELRKLREENKELHGRLKENVLAKRKLNEETLPELRKKKKTLQSDKKR